MKAPLPLEIRAQIRRHLLAWFRKNARSLPWRESPTPYGIWVSEIMCQQTRVEVVRDYYARWMKAFPDLQALAKAHEDDVLRLWQGLGYYSRARRLRAGAIHVTERLGGELPRAAEELVEIPGIGPYSAGAISSIAFGEPSAIVDGNVIRVLTRLFALPGDPNKAPLKQQLWSLAGELVLRKDASDFNQALMEFGALLCTPKSPACHACPLRKSCEAYQAGEVSSYPQLPKRAKPTPLSMVVVIVRHRGRTAIEKIPTDGRWWAGLDALPFAEIAEGESVSTAALRLAKKVAAVKPSDLILGEPLVHTVTRFKITLTPVLARATSRRPGAPHRWVPQSGLGDLALPAPHKKALAGTLA